jgi:transcription-repair coupling factor (superfamily II helicase)
VEQGSFAKVRPDMSVVFIRELDGIPRRLKETTQILRGLVTIAKRAKKAA